MGSGNWFKTFVSRKKVKVEKAKQLKVSDKSSGEKNKSLTEKKKANGKVKSNGALPSEDVAATRIQTAFRAYMARKTLRRMKGIVRFRKLTERKSVKQQCSSTLAHLRSWSRIQAGIKDRHQFMVTEGRLKQKKLDRQLKLDAKLHDLEVEWNSGSFRMEDILARIHQREEAVVKRERSMAYAFSHQWRTKCNENQGPYSSELRKANWGWSWKERWIAARPWEIRLPSQSISPKKVQNKPTNKTEKVSNIIYPQKSFPSKTLMMKGKGFGNGRRMSYPGTEKPAVIKSDMELQETTVKKTVFLP